MLEYELKYEVSDETDGCSTDSEGNYPEQLLFDTKKEAIDYIVNHFINALLEENDFHIGKSCYLWRKVLLDFEKEKLYGDWNSVNINFLEKYLEENHIDNKEIKRFLLDRKDYFGKKRKNQYINFWGKDAGKTMLSRN